LFCAFLKFFGFIYPFSASAFIQQWMEPRLTP
jgi:hypothetical protein